MYQIDYQYLRPKKAQWLKRMYNTPFEEKTNLSVWEGDRATILPLREIPNEGLLFGRGGVLDAQQNYVALSGIPDRIGKGYPCPSSEYRDETVVYCGYMVNHWGHFLVEATTRLWYALKENPAVDKYVFFLEENQQRQIKGNYQEFFQLLGIWDKLELISQPTTYRHVIVPEISFQVMHSWSPEFLAVFDTIAAKITPQLPAGRLRRRCSSPAAALPRITTSTLAWNAWTASSAATATWCWPRRRFPSLR